jgi:stage IV sporulation protein FB
VFLSEPSETRFDLRFWLFGVHVRVHPFFWLLSIILGWRIVDEAGDQRTGLIYLGLWVISVFVSILIHEMGHVFMGRLFGSHGHIVLYSFGGLAIGSNALNRGWQRFLVSFAGPLVQFVVLALTILTAVSFFPRTPNGWQEQPSFTLEYLFQIKRATTGWQAPALVMLNCLFQINLFWPLLNLLPIWPLDGGQMAREVFVGITPRNGASISFAISACIAALLAVHCLMAANGHPLIRFLPFGGFYMALFFGYFCYMSFQGLQAENARRQQYRDDEFPWER